jgi:hypothetical protein
MCLSPRVGVTSSVADVAQRRAGVLSDGRKSLCSPKQEVAGTSTTKSRTLLISAQRAAIATGSRTLVGLGLSSNSPKPGHRASAWAELADNRTQRKLARRLVVETRQPEPARPVLLHSPACTQGSARGLGRGVGLVHPREWGLTRLPLPPSSATSPRSKPTRTTHCPPARST